MGSSLQQKTRHAVRVSNRFRREMMLDIKNGEPGKAMHLMQHLIKRSRQDLPTTITIEPTNTCNLHCDFCSSPPEKHGRKKGLMKLEDFKTIVDDAAPLASYLWLFLAGEPYIAPWFEEMVAHASKRNLHTITSTNMVLVKPERAKRTVEAGLDTLIVSIDGATEETYDQMRLGGNFKAVEENLRALVEEKKRQKKVKPYVELQFIVSKKNQHEVELFKEWAASFGDVHPTFKTMGVPEWILTKEESEKVREAYVPKTGKRRYEDEGARVLKRSGLCSYRFKPTILIDGTHTMCCYDIKGDYTLGNVLETPFSEMWTSKPYQKLRERMGNRQLPLCKVCGETNEYF